MKLVKTATLSTKCQITIPKEVRKKLHIDSGGTIAFYFDGDDVKVTSNENLELKLKDKAKTSTVKNGGKNNE